VNNRDKNFTRNKIDRRRAQLEESVLRYLRQLETADRRSRRKLWRPRARISRRSSPS
jgi:hypothetical protein